MRCSSLLFLVLTFAAYIPNAFAAGTEADCPVTQAPAQPFVPPKGYHPDPGGDFALGTLGLWANVYTHWKLNFNQNKIPFFSEDFIFGKNEPRLVVVARRLDSPAPLVWADFVTEGDPVPKISNNHGFMITSLPIPTVGCWEITARYSPSLNKNHALTYTVWVGP